MSRRSHLPAADNFDVDVAGLGPTSRSRANQQMGQRQGPGLPPTMQDNEAILGTRTGENVEQRKRFCISGNNRNKEHRRLLSEAWKKIHSWWHGAEDVPWNKLSKQDHGEGERSEQRDQAELAWRAQASPYYHRLRRGEKDISSDEDDAGMCTGRMPAPSPHGHKRNESSMSLPPQKPLLVHGRSKNWTNPEDKLLIQAQRAPNRKEKSWKDIASNIPGRTGNQCRLRWDTLLKIYRKEHFNQGRSEEEYFDLLFSGRISCGQAKSSQRDHLQERAGESWKKRKAPEIDVAQDCHCKRERLFEVHETTSILQRILKIYERILELKELKYERKTSGTEQATSQGDGLRAAGVGTTHWSSGQTNFVVPLHQEPVEQQFRAFLSGGCEEGDGLRAAGVGTTHWSSGQTNFVVPLHQEPVEQQFRAFLSGGCEEGVPQSNFYGI